jgi:hypothetical protein
VKAEQHRPIYSQFTDCGLSFQIKLPFPYFASLKTESGEMSTAEYKGLNSPEVERINPFEGKQYFQ